MIIKKYSLILFILVALLACKTSKYNEPAPDYSNSYFPLDPGITHTYIHNDDKSEIVASKITNDLSFQENLMFYGVIYGTNEIYYSQSGSIYFMVYSPQPGDNLSIPILDYLQGGGYTSTTFPSTDNSTDKDRVESTLTTVKIGDSEKVNGITYNDVIHTTVEITHPDNETEDPVIYDFYFAKGVGLIEIDKTTDGFIYDTLTLLH